MSIAAALDAADALGVLAVLESWPVSPTTVAATCRITVRGAAALLDALDVLGLVDRVDDTRSSARPGADRQRRESARPATAEAEPVFSAPPGSAARVAALARSGRLRDEIRDGRSRHAADSGAGAAVLPAVVGSLAAAMHEPAAHLADWLPHPAGHVLDVGAGAAPWSIALAEADPSCHVTALDLPEVLAVTRQAVADASMQSRVQLPPRRHVHRAARTPVRPGGARQHLPPVRRRHQPGCCNGFARASAGRDDRDRGHSPDAGARSPVLGQPLRPRAARTRRPPAACTARTRIEHGWRRRASGRPPYGTRAAARRSASSRPKHAEREEEAMYASERSRPRPGPDASRRGEAPCPRPDLGVQSGPAAPSSSTIVPGRQWLISAASAEPAAALDVGGAQLGRGQEHALDRLEERPEVRSYPFDCVRRAGDREPLHHVRGHRIQLPPVHRPAR